MLDPITRQPVTLNDKSESERVALCFPKSDLVNRELYRLPWSKGISLDVISKGLLEAAKGGNATMREFVLANFDFLGEPCKYFMARLQMNAQYRKVEAAAIPEARARVDAIQEVRDLYGWSEISITMPFEQLTRDAEQRVARVVGNFEAVQALSRALAPTDVAGCWFLMKAAVSSWEQKLSSEQWKLEVAERELADVFKIKKDSDDLRETIEAKGKSVATSEYNLALWREMDRVFCSEETTQGKVRPEMRFLDEAFSAPTGVEVRSLAARWCGPAGSGGAAAPGEAELRHRIRLLDSFLSVLPKSNYGALAKKVRGVQKALAEGTTDDVDYYTEARKTLDFELLPDQSITNWNTLPTNHLLLPLWIEEQEKLKPQPRSELDWYDAADDEKDGGLVVPDMNQMIPREKILEELLNDPEKWEETIELRKDIAEAEAIVDAEGPVEDWLGWSDEYIEEILAGSDEDDDEELDSIFRELGLSTDEKSFIAFEKPLEVQLESIDVEAAMRELEEFAIENPDDARDVRELIEKYLGKAE